MSKAKILKFKTQNKNKKYKIKIIKSNIINI